MHYNDIKQETKEMKIVLFCYRQLVTKTIQKAVCRKNGRKDKVLKDIENLYRDNFNGKTI